MSASQPTHTSSGLNLFGPGPLVTPSPMAGSTTNNSTGTTRTLFGNPEYSQPVTGATQGLNPEPRGGILGSNSSSFSSSSSLPQGGAPFGSFPPRGTPSSSLLQGGATSSPFGSSAFGSTTAPKIGFGSNMPPSQPSPSFPLPSGNSQSKAESTMPFPQLSNSSRR